MMSEHAKIGLLHKYNQKALREFKPSTRTVLNSYTIMNLVHHKSCQHYSDDTYSKKITIKYNN